MKSRSDKHDVLSCSNYDSLWLGSKTDTVDTPLLFDKYLQRQCCSLLCGLGCEAVEYVLDVLPVHLATMLLAEAISGEHTSVASAIIGSWPLSVLWSVTGIIVLIILLHGYNLTFYFFTFFNVFWAFGLPST